VIRWRVDIENLAGPLAAITTGVALGTSAGIQLVAASDGSTTKTLALPSQPQAIGVAADGTMAANIDGDVHRFSAAGVELPVVTLAGSMPLAATDMAFDSTGALYVMRGYTELSGAAAAKLSRIASTGTLSYTVDLDTTAPDNGSTGGGEINSNDLVVVGGHVVTIRRHLSRVGLKLGAIIESFDAETGARSWFQEKAAREVGAGNVAGFVGGQLVVAPSGNVQLVGFRGDEMQVQVSDPTIETLAP